MERKSFFRVMCVQPSDEDLLQGTPALRKDAEFFAAPDALGTTGGSKLVEGTGTVCLDRVLGNEKPRRDLSIAKTMGDQSEDFELARCNAEGMLLVRIENKRLSGGRFRRDTHLQAESCQA
jgi:hypothetical protein